MSKTYWLKLFFKKKSYSQAVVADRTVYVSGCLGMTKDLKIVTGGAAAEAKMALENMGHVLTASGSSFDKVVKTTIFLNDINDFGAVNEEYKKCKYTYQIFIL